MKTFEVEVKCSECPAKFLTEYNRYTCSPRCAHQRRMRLGEDLRQKQRRPWRRMTTK